MCLVSIRSFALLRSVGSVLGYVEATSLRLRRLTRPRTDSFLFKSDIRLSGLQPVSANGMDVVKFVHEPFWLKHM